MRFISHRGNINGKKLDKENNPDYIKRALNLGYDVEIDVWYEDGNFKLGHDNPEHMVSKSFLYKEGLWLHCKTIITLDILHRESQCNCFFHDVDDVVLTSKQYLWTYPGKTLYSNSICVLPENSSMNYGVDIAGICSDFISMYRKEL